MYVVKEFGLYKNSNSSDPTLHDIIGPFANAEDASEWLIKEKGCAGRSGNRYYKHDANSCVDTFFDIVPLTSPVRTAVEEYNLIEL